MTELSKKAVHGLNIRQLCTANIKGTSYIDENSSRVVRFVDGGACCTTTYNYKMTIYERAYLASRIALALNATRFMSDDEILQLQKTQEALNGGGDQ